MEWGMAEEAGYAVEWLESRGADGVKCLARNLEYQDEENITDFATCPIHVGSAISDCGGFAGQKALETSQPLLLIPFIAPTLGPGCVKLSWAKAEVLLSKDLVWYENANKLADKGIFECSVESCEKPSKGFKPRTRVNDEKLPFVEILQKFAHRTYAPATEASRMKGAGSGLNDND